MTHVQSLRWTIALLALAAMVLFAAPPAWAQAGGITLSGFFFLDPDNDGLFQPGETILGSPYGVELTAPDGTVIGAASSPPGQPFLLSNVADTETGTYTLAPLLPLQPGQFYTVPAGGVYHHFVSAGDTVTFNDQLFGIGTAQSVPEPSSFVLLVGSCVSGLFAFRRLRRR